MASIKKLSNNNSFLFYFFVVEGFGSFLIRMAFFCSLQKLIFMYKNDIV